VPSSLGQYFNKFVLGVSSEKSGSSLSFSYFKYKTHCFFFFPFLSHYYTFIFYKKMSSKVPTFESEVSPGRVLTMDADGTGLSVVDPWLKPFNDALRER
jgi:hypothetical protein